MSNGRSMRRKMSGKSGGSPAKSQRRQAQRQRAAWQMQASLARMSSAAEPLIKTMADAFNTKENDDGDGNQERPDGTVDAEERAEGQGG